MNRLIQLFQQKNKDLLNIYFTAGYPNLKDTESIILALDQAGVDLIEVGMPYSDPLADGPTIQESSEAALANGMKLDLLFDQIAAARRKTAIPLIMMGYFNQMMQYGEEKFLQKCSEVGVDGLIIPDLPLYEYEHFYRDLFNQYEIAISFLITPQTSTARILKVDELSNGFIYMVSNSSITGAKSSISDQQLAYFNRINALDLKSPKLIGFGISSNETYKQACNFANGAIIGSAFIRALKGAENLPLAIQQFVDAIKGRIESEAVTEV